MSDAIYSALCASGLPGAVLHGISIDLRKWRRQSPTDLAVREEGGAMYKLAHVSKDVVQMLPLIGFMQLP